MTYFTIQQIKNANREAGYHFFDKDSVRFFRSRIAPGVIGGRYFITSEQYDGDSQRFYTIRVADDNGNIDTVGEFQQYGSLNQARRAARKIAAQEPSQSQPCTNCQRWTLNRDLTNDGHCPDCAARND